MMNTDTSDASDGSAGGDRGISSTLDATLDLLANSRRRYVLYCLRKQGGTVTVEDLAEQVLAWERDSGRGTRTTSTDGPRIDDPSDPTEGQVVADLHHCHLPRLEDEGVVTYDAESGYVSLAEAGEEPLTEYLELAASEEGLDPALPGETSG